MAKIQNPHDKFFKSMLSVPGAAAAFMDYFLPYNISSMLDLETLQLVSAEFLDPKMSGLFADLIFYLYYS